MKLKRIKTEDAKLSLWAGGESREYYIEPGDASYQKVDFDCRISRAVSSKSSWSRYTMLPGIERFLVLLQGEAKLRKAGTEKNLSAFSEIMHFEGEEAWESMGVYSDLNLMLSRNCWGRMALHHENFREDYGFLDLLGLYAEEKGIEIQLPDQTLVSEAQELILIEDMPETMFLQVDLHGKKLVRIDVKFGMGQW